MEDNENNVANAKKRARVDSESDSGSGPEERKSKRVEIDSVSNSDTSRVDSLSGSRNIVSVSDLDSSRDDSLSDTRNIDSVSGSDASRDDSPSDSRNVSVCFESGVISNDILNILEDADIVPEILDLDSVIRSFEEEILQTAAPAVFSDESQPDLGYLLEASDDELGLPPASSPSPNNEFPPSHDSFGFGEHYEVMNEFLTVGGLFEYPDASDFAELLWRPETESLPAV